MGNSVPNRNTVTAVARMPNHLDLFVVGHDGGIYSTWWHDGHRWAEWFRIGREEHNVPNGNTVTTVAREPNHLDLFVVGHDGGIYSTWWHEGQPWAEWFRIGPEAANVPNGNTVTAVARMPNHLDLFVVGHNGGICSAWWHDGQPWSGWFRIGYNEFLVVHLKSMLPITGAVTTCINTGFTNLQQLLSQFEIRVFRGTTEDLSRNPALAHLVDVDVGDCEGDTMGEQEDLFGNRNNVGAGDLVVYFVRSTNPPSSGCATHPDERPGAVVAQGATQWTLAHEIGHVLDLDHVDDNNRLMTGNGTGNITNPPPDLSPDEVDTMLESELTRACSPDRSGW